MVGKEERYGTGGVAQVVECLPNKCEVLTSNPSTTLRKQPKKRSDIGRMVWKLRDGKFPEKHHLNLSNVARHGSIYL
jgi:hypothetical protein